MQNGSPGERLLLAAGGAARMVYLAASEHASVLLARLGVALAPAQAPIEGGAEEEVFEEPQSPRAGEIEMAGVVEVEGGDLLLLGSAGPAEYQHQEAIVTRALGGAECVAAVLDAARQRRVGSCQLASGDYSLTHSDWRLGQEVVVGGLKNAKLKDYNGASGVIVAHPREGHPCFPQETAVAGEPKVQPKLVLCVKLAQRDGGKPQLVLLEPKFLSRSDGQGGSTGQEVPSPGPAAGPERHESPLEF